ncbi:MAG TPA: glycosyltransferase family 1 protein [Bryobacteraceae bacterium]|nr:glycosyltransferase family 1 protein [Bryobacteraceae bacterium]
MRIGIDGSALLLRSAGVKTWTWHWIEALRRCAPEEDRIEAFPFIGDLPPLTHERSVLGRPATWLRLALLAAINTRHSPAVDLFAGRFDVFHLSNQVRRAPRKTRCTATIHDLTCWIMPELHSSGNILADMLFVERVLRRTAALIAVSHSTKSDAVRWLQIDPERIEVIYPGISDAYFDPQPCKAARPYVLYVGTIEPRKNLDALLNAWGALRRSVREEYDLICAGPPGWGEKTMARLRAGENGVRYAGYVPESDLPGLFAGATAFAYPSLYEGFGFPVAQAMAARVPVLTSNISSLPEIAGASAVLVDPRSEDEIRGGLERLLTSPSLRANLARQGATRAAEFRWDVCAKKGLDFFHRTAG